MSRRDKICHFGVVAETADETLGKSRRRICLGKSIADTLAHHVPFYSCFVLQTSIVVFCLAVLGIACSIVVCFSVDYFSFVSLRNDTFTDPTGQKQQPHPFEHATEANVGIFRYEILDVYEYPWPPKQQERRLFDELHNRELRRLAAEEKARASPSRQNDAAELLHRMRKLQNETGDDETPVDVVDDSSANVTVGENATETSGNSTLADNETDTDTAGGNNETKPELTKPPDVDLTPAPTALGNPLYWPRKYCRF
jgi:hypothetical protein